LPANVKFEVEQVLDDGSYLSWIYPDGKSRKKGAQWIQVRVIEYTIDCDEVQKTYRLISSLMDITVFPALLLASEYHQRWEIENTIDELKTHLLSRKTPIRSLKEREPAGAISIRGSSGQPLMASKWGDKGAEIASRDAGTFVVGSLAKVGKVLNQPKEEQYSASNGFGGTTTFSSTRRGGPNILGAVLEGGFEPLTEQILERNRRALSEIQQREEVWYVRPGTDVQVFINQSFQF